ncbi:MAG: hypothetical protein CVV64_15530 [Candidatus Wallbacteria bacterium HGW-Wallbacteria-1]|jgi:ubiquinone/menaquinone biosynthesis C-methylase UbiE|uniref:Methyltransferase domain-containing protein n=1 Tax=Candidatus Wallbacteria bacterium HGW-Wallbacteria-1 TaxID=2013854 RepID=A0A2N1PLK3_9BACT|nr:MAG: hypothetical protein CVV64_15530 [Candidatus Wallbacteria bacterium HGW-Wallbacteria-1]
MIHRIKALVKRLRHRLDFLSSNYNVSNTQFWTRENVTSHRSFKTRQESLDYLHWRNSKYLFIEKLMPLSGHDGLRILDYGCGPGHDAVGFAEFSTPLEVIGVDISASSLAEAGKRLKLHDASCVRLMKIEDNTAALPFPDSHFDLIHSAGVLHHTPNIMEILRELRRVMKPNGRMRVMVYNYDSVWVHLYVAWYLQVNSGIDSHLSLADAFRRSADGIHCPIGRCYRPAEFMGLCESCGFTTEFMGSAVSTLEMIHLPQRPRAIADLNLAPEHRDFLRELTFDAHGLPMINGHYAGIDGVFELRLKG